MRIGETAVVWGACLLIFAGVWGAASGGIDPRKVSVLYTGDPYPGPTPYVYMKVEPLLYVTPIQASTAHHGGISAQDIRRAIRVYMPRNYDSLLQGYKVIIISDANVGSFTNKHQSWFRKGVAEGGLGLVMVGGYETFGCAGGNPDWGPTQVGDLLPVQTVAGQYEPGRVTILDPDHVFMSTLPWRPNLPFLQDYSSNIVEIKPGGKVLARSIITPGRPYAGWENPFFSTWDYQNGTVFAMTGDWTLGGGWLFLEWEYLSDFATNLMLFCSKTPIPKDLDLVHTVRTRLATLGYRRIIIFSLIDFVERFGANPRKVLLVMSEVEEAMAQASDLYLDQDFDGTLEAVENAFTLMDRAEAASEKVKNEALLWVYISEWLVITATSLICGFGLWTLMVRRRLYREVGTTEFRR